MNALRKLQLDFAGAIIEQIQEGVYENIMALGIDAGRRLQIYRNNFYIGLTEALGAVYPVIQRLVGDDFFNFMAKDYIRLHPSRSGNLHDFGAQVATFIVDFTPAKDLLYLPDVARLEWAYHRVFHAAPSSGLDLGKLQQVQEKHYADLTFTFNPAGELVASNYPILRIWQANQVGENRDEHRISNSGVINLNEGADRLLVIRRGLDIELQTLSPGEYAFLKALARGQTLSAACELAVHSDPQCDIHLCLQQHVQSNTLVDFTVK
jgi:hypothetical protein